MKLMHISFPLLLSITTLAFADRFDKWTNFTKDDGLASNSITAICMDADGALWFGTSSNSVSQYHEGTWTTHSLGHPWSSAHVTAIIQDSKGVLWFGTERDGVSKYENDQWEIINTGNSGICSNNIHAIYEDMRGAIWFCTQNNGVCRYQQGVWDTLNTANSQLAANEVIDMVQDRSGAYWFLTSGEGVCRYDQSGWTNYNAGNSALTQNMVTAIAEDNEGTIWCGTNRGNLFVYRDDTWRNVSTGTIGLWGNGITAIIQDSQDAIWIGGIGGAFRYKNGVWSDLRPYSEAQFFWFYVNALLEDNQGHMWFATDDNGAFLFKERLWENFNTLNSDLASNAVNRAIEAEDGSMWFATEDAGLSAYKDNVWTTFDTSNSGLASNSVKCLFQDSRNIIWVGTAGSGINSLTNGHWETYSSRNGFLPQFGDYVYSIFEDSKGALWFAGSRGAYKYFNGNWEIISSTNSGLAYDGVLSILEDDSGHYWFGTNEGYISRFNGSVWQTYDTRIIMAEKVIINTIIKDADGILWAGTGNGLLKFSNETWEVFLQSDDIFAYNNITSIAEDKEGFLWLGIRVKGLTVFKEEEILTFEPQNSGLTNTDIKSVMEDSENTIWICTHGGGISAYGWIDHSPPTIRLLKYPDNITGNPSPLFNFLGKDAQTNEQFITYSYAILDAEQIPNDALFSPYTRDTSVEISPPLENDTYTFYVRAKDLRGNISKPAAHTFTADVTYPVAVIDEPSDKEMISGNVAVIGSAFDESPLMDFKSFVLSYRKNMEHENAEWDTLVYKTEQTKSDTLFVWDVSEKSGVYQLWLSAEDTLGHTNNYTINVDVVNFALKVSNRLGGLFFEPNNRVQLYLPPYSLDETQKIAIARADDLDPATLNDTFRNLDLVYDIKPQGLKLNKSGTISFFYSAVDLSDVQNEERLAIFRYNENSNKWIFIGGTVDVKESKVTSTVSRLGRYGLFEKLTESSAQPLSKLQCQPRIINPRGNGFDSKTSIAFSLSKPSPVTVKVYNLAGRLKKCIVENRPMNQGQNVVEWDGRDENGQIVASDLYIVTVQGEGKIVKKTISVLNR